MTGIIDDVRLTLKRSRKSAGFTQKVLAEKLGVSESTVSRWENGGNIPMDKMHFWLKSCKTLVRMTISGSGDLPLEEICSKCNEERCTGRRLFKGSVLLDGSEESVGLDICYVSEVPLDCPFIVEQAVMREAK